MAQIVITIEDAKENRVIASYAKALGWDNNNPLTKKEFMKKELIKHIKKTIRDQEYADAILNSNDTITQDVESIVIT